MHLWFSGLQIVYNIDEVALIQNLVFYIEEAYRIPVSVVCKDSTCHQSFCAWSVFDEVMIRWHLLMFLGIDAFNTSLMLYSKLW